MEQIFPGAHPDNTRNTQENISEQESHQEQNLESLSTEELEYEIDIALISEDAQRLQVLFELCEERIFQAAQQRDFDETVKINNFMQGVLSRASESSLARQSDGSFENKDKYIFTNKIEREIHDSDEVAEIKAFRKKEVTDFKYKCAQDQHFYQKGKLPEILKDHDYIKIIQRDESGKIVDVAIIGTSIEKVSETHHLNLAFLEKTLPEEYRQKKIYYLTTASSLFGKGEKLTQLIETVAGILQENQAILLVDYPVEKGVPVPDIFTRKLEQAAEKDIISQNGVEVKNLGSQVFGGITLSEPDTNREVPDVIKNTDHCQILNSAEIDDQFAEELWEVYQKSFGDTEMTCIQQQICFETFDIFKKALNGGGYTAFILRGDDNEVIGFSIAGKEAEAGKTAFAHAETYIKKFGVNQAYLSIIAVLPDQKRNIKSISNLVEMIARWIDSYIIFGKKRSTASFDFSLEKNKKLPSVLEFISKRTQGGKKEDGSSLTVSTKAEWHKLGQQKYVAFIPQYKS